MVENLTNYNNMSAPDMQKFIIVKPACPVSCINKTDRPDALEILLKVALNTNNTNSKLYQAIVAHLPII